MLARHRDPSSPEPLNTNILGDKAITAMWPVRKGVLQIPLGIAVLVATAVAAIAFVSIVGLASAEESEDWWFITQDTTFRDGSLNVNRSVSVENGTLLLENMTVYFSSNKTRSIIVSPPGSLVARHSTLYFNGQYTGMSIGNDVVFEDCGLYFNCYPSIASIMHWSGLLSIEGCWLEGRETVINSQGELAVGRSRLTSISYYRYTNIVWGAVKDPVAGFNSLLIEESLFKTRYGSSGYVAIQLESRTTQVPDGENASVPMAVISNCTFDGPSPFNLGTYGSSFLHPVLVTGCTGMNITSAALVNAGANALLRENRWTIKSGEALHIWLAGPASPTIYGGVMEGGDCGLTTWSDGGSAHLTVEGVSFNGSKVAVYTYGADIDLVGCKLRAVQWEVWAEAGAWVHLFRCDHTRLSRVDYGGEVVDLVDVEVLSLSWQDGSPVQGGTVIFEPCGNYAECRLDVTQLGTVWLPTWILDTAGSFEVRTIRGYTVVEDHYFWTEYLHVPLTDRRLDLTLYDDFYPVVTVGSPLPDSYLNRSTIEMRGEVREVGSGLSSVEARVDGGPWCKATVVNATRWAVALPGNSEGRHLLEVRASDRTGLFTVVKVHNVCVDTVSPSIEWTPSTRWVCETPVVLHFSTDPDASACFAARPVQLSTYGTFTVMVDLVEGDNTFEVVSVDPAGNVARATVLITLDTVAPALRLTRPQDQSWSRSTTVLVEGTAEPGATVEVNGRAAANIDGLFRLPFEGTDGAHLVSARAYDAAGNVAIAELVVHIDTTPPVVLQETIVGAYVTSGAALTVYGSVLERNLAWVVPTQGNLTLEGEAWTLELPLLDGVNNVTVMAADMALNRGSVSFEVVRDITGPVVTAMLVTDTGGVQPDTTGAVCGNATVRLWVTLEEDCRLILKGTWTIAAKAGETWTSVLLAPGENELVLYATDALGNRGQNVTLRVVRDVEPPPLEVLEILGGRRVETHTYMVQGRTEPGARLVVGGIETVAGATGNFSVEVGLKEGKNQILVVASDRFGNEARRAIWVTHTDASPRTPVGDGAVPTAAVGTVAGLLVLLALLVVLRRSAMRTKDKEQAEAEHVQGGPVEGVEASRLGGHVRRRGG